MKAVSVVLLLALVAAGTFACSPPRLFSNLATSDLACSSKLSFMTLLLL